MAEAVTLLLVPFLACVVLTGIHAYLGLHIIERGVIFVDLALAQVAALGVTMAFLAGHPLQSRTAYLYSLVFTLVGAAIFALSRPRRTRVSQEAVIGIVYAVSAAVAILVVDRAPQGSEHIKHILIGSILTVTGREVAGLTGLYALVGAFHWLCRRPFLAISLDPDGAGTQGVRVRLWDFLFYASFGVVVTSSVRIAGVLLVFSYLVVPALAGSLWTRRVGLRLALGWALGFLASVLGLSASYAWDLPTGAAVVATFGVVLLVTVAVRVLPAGVEAVRRLGLRRAVGLGLLALSALLILAAAGLLLFPTANHLWLDGLEAIIPPLRWTFLTPYQRETERMTWEDIAWGEADLERLRRLQSDAVWGVKPLPPETMERLQQVIVGRREILMGDRLVLRSLRQKARERQRFALGLPLLATGMGGLLMGWRWQSPPGSGKTALPRQGDTRSTG